MAQFKVNDIYVELEIYFNPNPDCDMQIYLEINDYEYSEDTNVGSRLDMRGINKMMKSAKIDNPNFKKFLVNFLNNFKCHFEIQEEYERFSYSNNLTDEILEKLYENEIEPYNIQILMDHTNCTFERASEVLIKCKNDLDDSITYITGS